MKTQNLVVLERTTMIKRERERERESFVPYESFYANEVIYRFKEVKERDRMGAQVGS